MNLNGEKECNECVEYLIINIMLNIGRNSEKLSVISMAEGECGEGEAEAAEGVRVKCSEVTSIELPAAAAAVEEHAAIGVWVGG
jgi:hypothetical protein